MPIRTLPPPASTRVTMMFPSMTIFSPSLRVRTSIDLLHEQVNEAASIVRCPGCVQQRYQRRETGIFHPLRSRKLRKLAGGDQTRLNDGKRCAKRITHMGDFWPGW